MFELQDLIDILAKKYPDLYKSEIELICRSQFRFLRDRVEDGEFKTVSLKHLGKFYPYKRTSDRFKQRIKDEGGLEYLKLNRRKEREEKYKKRGDDEENV